MNGEGITVIPALGDNYIYLYQTSPGKAFAVDPADARAVTKKLEKLGLELGAVLATHHHYDHTAGIGNLKKRYGCRVYSGDAKRITATDRQLGDGSTITIDDTEIRVINTPGHTATSVCYYISAGQTDRPLGNAKKILFTGDTLFVAGCGRLFEADAKTMYKSLQKIAALEPETLVYPGHDYTIENYRFALSIEPANLFVKDRLQQAKKLLSETSFTVPSTVADELAANPFLRTDSEVIKSALKMPANTDPVEVFAELRRRKDRF